MVIHNPEKGGQTSGTSEGREIRKQASAGMDPWDAVNEGIAKKHLVVAMYSILPQQGLPSGPAVPETEYALFSHPIGVL